MQSKLTGTIIAFLEKFVMKNILLPTRQQ